MAKNNTTLLLVGAAAAAFLFRKQLGIGAMRGENLHLIAVKYLGPTNSRGSRIKLESKRFKQSITLSYDYRVGNGVNQAMEYLEQKGFRIVGSGEFGDTDVIITSTFEPLK